MSRHRLVKNLNAEDIVSEFDGYDYEDEEDQLSPEDREAMANGTAEVRLALGTESDKVTTDQIQEALWHYYYDVDKSVTYLIKTYVAPPPKLTPKKVPEGEFCSKYFASSEFFPGKSMEQTASVYYQQTAWYRPRLTFRSQRPWSLLLGSSTTCLGSILPKTAKQFSSSLLALVADYWGAAKDQRCRNFKPLPLLGRRRLPRRNSKTEPSKQQRIYRNFISMAPRRKTGLLDWARGKGLLRSRICILVLSHCRLMIKLQTRPVLRMTIWESQKRRNSLHTWMITKLTPPRVDARRPHLRLLRSFAVLLQRLNPNPRDRRFSPCHTQITHLSTPPPLTNQVQMTLCLRLRRKVRVLRGRSKQLILIPLQPGKSPR